ncbi:MAG: histidyl-tRNA synthetase [Parcubacteria group bacterium Gr01-1014_30]|nr:MAG: histidyl-tRNA synthetase [Parcubacteria group bacterium Gr01-1014_30]
MAKKPKFQRPTGMYDILPEDQKYFQKVLRACEGAAEFYGFEKIDTPVLEETALFEKGTGLSTDIVQKEMYSLRTKGGDYLTLRPEWTPGIVRAYIEHGMFNLPQPVKLWHFGPVFRHERPQAGRLREFKQFGFEVFGEVSSVIDAQIIQIFCNILKELRLKNIVVEINSIGDSKCRPYYKKMLVSYFRSREQGLCSDCRRRLRENPLRILDCKEEKCRFLVSQAPQLIDHLCEECHSHFKEVLEFLDELEIPYHLNPYLVRGLDYYTKTAFEIYENSHEGRQQGALPSGGRYDNLVKHLGGKDTPASGGASGVERIVNLLKARGLKFPQPPSPKIFLAQLGSLAKRKGVKLMENFRKERIPVAESFGRDSLKAQMARANKLGVEYTLILGQREALEGEIIVRDMENGNQTTVKLDEAVAEMEKRAKK